MWKVEVKEEYEEGEMAMDVKMKIMKEASKRHDEGRRSKVQRRVTKREHLLVPCTASEMP